MNESKNALELFQKLLANFQSALNSAKAFTTCEQQDSIAINIAVIGFSQFSNTLEWSAQHAEFIANRLAGELSPDALNWYEECAEAVSIFSCFALGALLGQLQSSEIEDAEFTLGEAHLAGFIALHNGEICAAYPHTP